MTAKVPALVLTLPMPMNLANARMHWRVKQKAKKAYWDHLNILATCRVVFGPDLHRIPPAPVAPFARARIASLMFVGAKMDADNAMARHKWALDWLQGAGYIANDRNLEWVGVPEQVVKRDGNYRLVLTLTELP